MAKTVLNQLAQRIDLDFDEMHQVMTSIMQGDFTPCQISGILMALRTKTETVEEIAAAAKVMQSMSNMVKTQHTASLIDTCGTGGDGIRTFNISTASAFVAAAAGVRVAKHGGRSVSSSSGSADVLEALGVNINLTADKVGKSIDEVGIGFMFAPNHHVAMKHVAPIRRDLGVRTLFNVLGPLTNPAGARRQLIGVFAQHLTRTLAEVLQRLGSEHVLVVHGADGTDEISISGATFVTELKRGKLHDYQIHPGDVGLPVHDLSAIQVANTKASCAMVLGVLEGRPGAARDIVLLNAGAAIYVSGLAKSLPAAVKRAQETIDTRAALQILARLVAYTNQA